MKYSTPKKISTWTYHNPLTSIDACVELYPTP